MHITCPHCGFGENVPDERIPPGASEVTCPRCKKRFALPRPAAAEPATRAAIAEPVPEPVPETVPQPVADDLVTCPLCDQRQPRAAYCSRCGAQLPGAVADDTRYAGFWIRVAAAIIDSLLVGMVQMLVSLLFGGLTATLTGGYNAEAAWMPLVMTWLFSTTVGFAYYVVFTGACGQTPGKMLVRIRVVRGNGDAIGYGRALLREVPGKMLSGLLLCIGYLMVAFDARKQGLHDKLADTCVVHI
jgi:predicted Zn finger-like uncharacterized protein